MKVCVAQELGDLDGKPLQNVISICLTCGRPSEERGVHTLRSVCVAALLATYQDEVKISGNEKLTRYTLAQKIHDEDELDLRAEDIVLLKNLVAKAFGPLVVGQVWKMLEV